MKHGLRIYLLVLLCFFPDLHAQTDEPESPKIEISNDILQHIPSPYREEVVQLHLKATAEDQKKVLELEAMQPDAAFMLALKGMSVNPLGFDFMTRQLSQEASADRRTMILKYGIQPQIRRAREGEQRNNISTVLTQLAQQDPDANVSLEAIAALRRLQWGHSSQLTLARVAKARSAGDTAGAAKLIDDADKWVEWDGQMNLPNFMRTPPPVFNVPAKSSVLHVLAFGDFGTGSPEQLKLAGVMKQYQEKKPFDFGITLGDNFYPNGVGSPDDPQWKTKWEDVYNPLGIPFYASLGNHDYLRPDDRQQKSCMLR